MVLLVLLVTKIVFLWMLKGYGCLDASVVMQKVTLQNHFHLQWTLQAKNVIFFWKVLDKNSNKITSPTNIALLGAKKLGLVVLPKGLCWTICGDSCNSKLMTGSYLV
jgi:hypothetical protein